MKGYSINIRNQKQSDLKVKTQNRELQQQNKNKLKHFFQMKAILWHFQELFQVRKLPWP